MFQSCILCEFFDFRWHATASHNMQPFPFTPSSTRATWALPLSSSTPILCWKIDDRDAGGGARHEGTLYQKC